MCIIRFESYLNTIQDYIYVIYINYKIKHYTNYNTNQRDIKLCWLLRKSIDISIDCIHNTTTLKTVSSTSKVI